MLVNWKKVSPLKLNSEKDKLFSFNFRQSIDKIPTRNILKFRQLQTTRETPLQSLYFA